MGKLNRAVVAIALVAFAGGAIFWSGGARSAGLGSGSTGVGRGQIKTDFTSTPPPPQSRRQVVAWLANQPSRFVPNLGQFDRRVKFLSSEQGYMLFLTAKGAVLSLQRAAQKTAEPKRQETDIVRLSLSHPNPSAQIVGLDELPGKTNYLIGSDRSKWRTHVPNFARVEYRNVYPGIDLVYYGHQGQLEYDFVVHPGANPKAIALAVEKGMKKVGPDGSRMAMGRNGDVVIQTRGGKMRFEKPVVYQERTRGGRQLLSGHFALTSNHQIRFKIGSYDRSKPLVIDPILTYSTYLGGAGPDDGDGIAVGPNGGLFIVGSTESYNFPTLNPISGQTTKTGSSDIFITKLDPHFAGASSLLYSTYLGGGASDHGSAIAIDSSDNAYITGYTDSTGFPATAASSTTSGAFQTTNAGASVNGNNAFVAEISADGSSLLYFSYLGGSGGNDQGNAIAVQTDPAGNPHIYLVGTTNSTDLQVVNPIQAGNDGLTDAFVAEVSPNNTASSTLSFLTYLGGSASDYGQGVAVDSGGNIYVTGYTYSSDFPTQNSPGNGLDSANQSAGGANAFVAEINPVAPALMFSDYIGGNGGLDQAWAIALDSSNNIYIGGDTNSPNLPVTSGAEQPMLKGGQNGFIAKIAAGFTSLDYLTYLGGSNQDTIRGIAVDSSGNAYVTGNTLSDDFPLYQPFQANFASGNCGTPSSGLPCADAFVSEINPAGSSLIFSSYLGGSTGTFGNAVALGTIATNVTTPTVNIVGSTASENFPTIVGAYQSSYQFQNPGTTTNAFVAQIEAGTGPGLSVSPQVINFPNTPLGQTSPTQTVTITDEGDAGLTISSINTLTDFVVSNDLCTGTTVNPGDSCTLDIAFAPPSNSTAEKDTGQYTIVTNATSTITNGIATVTVNGTSTTSGSSSLSFSPSVFAFQPEQYGQQGPSQTFEVTNPSSTQAVDITSIFASSDFTLTTPTTCPIDSAASLLPSLELPAGASCFVYAAFFPQATGDLTGSITFKDNATGSPQAINLSGQATAQFTVSANESEQTVTVGSDTATFTATAANAPGVTAFPEVINLKCSAGTCAFNPSSINVGQTSALTISGLSKNVATTSPPTLNLLLEGTSASTSQTASEPLQVFFSDFTVENNGPDTISINAGQTTADASTGPKYYTIALTPINGFNKAVQLSCLSATVVGSGGVTTTNPLSKYGITCSWSSSVVTPTGNGPITSQLTLATEASTCAETPGGWPRFPQVPGMPVALALGAALLLLIVAAWKWRQFGLGTTSRRVRAAAVALAGVMLMAVAFASCGSSASTNCGTPADTYEIQVQGTYVGTNATVTRTNITTGNGNPFYLIVNQ